MKTRKHYKNSGFSGGSPKTQNDTFFFEKGVFGEGRKSGFYYVFEKLCSSENTFYIEFPAK